MKKSCSEAFLPQILQRAFSLVEMLMALLVASLLMAALAPVMTKRMDEASINISGVGAAQYDKDALVSVYTGEEGEDETFNLPDGVNMVKVIMVGGGGAGGNSFYGKQEVTSTKEWTVPEGVTRLRVFMLGGGGGGASGGVGVGTAYADIPALNADKTITITTEGTYKLSNLITVPDDYKSPTLNNSCKDSGISVWTVVSDNTTIAPNTKLKKVYGSVSAIKDIKACGAGGGAGGNGNTNAGGAGGTGYYKTLSSLNSFDLTNLYISVGGGGGGGGTCCAVGGTNGGYGAGGGGGTNGGGGIASGGNGGTYGGKGGSSAIGGDGTTGASTSTGGNGGYKGGSGTVYGAGGGGSGNGGSTSGTRGGGGGGGGPTLITSGSETGTVLFVAPGGGGGGGGNNSGGTGGGGGGGGGTGGGNGGAGKAGGTGSAGTGGSSNSTFSASTNCTGGTSSTANNVASGSGYPGAITFKYSSIEAVANGLKCQYNMPANGGGGGGAGQVTVGEISVTPGETLVFTIGRGGYSKTAAGKDGDPGVATTISRKSNGEILARAEGGLAGKYSSSETAVSAGGGKRAVNIIGTNWTGKTFDTKAGSDGKLSTDLLSKGFGGQGGESMNLRGETLSGGAGGNTVKNGNSPLLTNYGAGGGGGAGAQSAGDTFGAGAAGASGFIYFEYGGTNGGGGTSGEIITKLITNLKSNTVINIDIGKGGDNSTGDGNGKSTVITYDTGTSKTLTARGGLRGNDGGAGLNEHAAEKLLPDTYANKADSLTKGQEGSDAYGGMGGYIQELWENDDGTFASFVKAHDGKTAGPILGGCGGNFTTLTSAITCNGTTSTPNGKDGTFGGGGGGGAVVEETGGLGGKGGKGIVIIKYKAVGL